MSILTLTRPPQTAPSARPHGLLRVTTAGNVDDGKSTLIGRLLLDGKGLHSDQVAALSNGVDAGALDLALATDGLEAEREQGITIDVAYRYFSTPKRSFILADAPGHEQYTRNMVTAASQADVAIILIDASRLPPEGLALQTRRHAAVAALMGLEVVAAVNKLDLVGYRQHAFEDAAERFRAWAARIGLGQVHVAPIAARPGDNVYHPSPAMPWWRGETLMGLLERIEPRRRAHDTPLRFLVQRVTRGAGRLYAGRIASGAIAVGEMVKVAASNTRATVLSLESFDGPRPSASAGASVLVRLDREIDLARGDTLVRADDTVGMTQRLNADIVWLDDAPHAGPRRYQLKQGVRSTAARIDSVAFVRDLEDFAARDGVQEIAPNAIARARLITRDAVLADPFEALPNTGGFVLIDPLTARTVAAGLIRTR